MATNVQVYQEPNGSRWGARVVGEKETDPKLFDTREEAIQEGRRLAEERGGELLVHDESGETEKKEASAEEQ
jgi:uncharacterized protein DUF2188